MAADRDVGERTDPGQQAADGQREEQADAGEAHDVPGGPEHAARQHDPGVRVVGERRPGRQEPDGGPAQGEDQASAVPARRGPGRDGSGPEAAWLDGGSPAREATPALWLQLLTLPVAVAGLADSICITIQEETGSVLAGCPDEAGVVDCEAVLHSPESVIPGIPVAAGGIVFFAFLAAITSPRAWRSPWRKAWQWRLASLAVGMGLVIYLIYAELFEAGTIRLHRTSVRILHLRAVRAGRDRRRRLGRRRRSGALSVPALTGQEGVSPMAITFSDVLLSACK
jgi:uncharacterized membrane protein